MYLLLPLTGTEVAELYAKKHQNAQTIFQMPPNRI